MREWGRGSGPLNPVLHLTMENPQSLAVGFKEAGVRRRGPQPLMLLAGDGGSEVMRGRGLEGAWS